MDKDQFERALARFLGFRCDESGHAFVVEMDEDGNHIFPESGRLTCLCGGDSCGPREYEYSSYRDHAIRRDSLGPN
jgi:hypothetical protein